MHVDAGVRCIQGERSGQTLFHKTLLSMVRHRLVRGFVLTSIEFIGLARRPCCRHCARRHPLVAPSSRKQVRRARW